MSCQLYQMALDVSLFCVLVAVVAHADPWLPLLLCWATLPNGELATQARICPESTFPRSESISSPYYLPYRRLPTTSLGQHGPHSSSDQPQLNDNGSDMTLGC